MTRIIQQRNTEKNTFFVYYQGFIAVAAILVFFTRLDGILGEYGIGLPLLWLIAFIGISLPILALKLSKKNFQYLPKLIIVWCAVYLGFTSISILISSQTPDIQFIEDQIRSIVFLLLMVVLFSQYSLVRQWVKLAILLVTFANVFIYIYEFLNPLAFALVKDVPGRSGGFYVDSNTASCALVVGMIFTIEMIKPKYRIFYALFVLLGIAPTFSRGGMASWLMVVLILVVTKIIPKYQIALILLSIFITGTIVSTQVSKLSYIKNADGSEMFTDDTIRRVEFLLNPLHQDEEDFDDSRLLLVDKAWAKFASKPFLGNGVGGARIEGYSGDSEDSEGAGTHNIYLDSVLKYGFLGVLLYPGLLIASVWKATGSLKPYALVFLLFSIAWGFFSHTTMNAFFSLTTYAMMANFSEQSFLENS
jgi:O-antigen ligase